MTRSGAVTIAVRSGALRRAGPVAVLLVVAGACSESTGAPSTSVRAEVDAATGPSSSAETTFPGGPSVLATGFRDACEFGDDCLWVRFTHEGFDPAPRGYFCVFSDGRYGAPGTLGGTEPFPITGSDRACFTNDPGDWIEIEIDGVRSNRVSND